MINLKEIVDGWSHVLIKDEKTEAEAERRLSFCYGCKNRTQIIGIDCCSICSCPLLAKSRSVDSLCPAGKW